MKILKSSLILFLFCLIASSAYTQSSFYYKIPFIPLTFVFYFDGTVDVSIGHEITTPLGTIGFDHSQRLINNRYSNNFKINNISIEEQDLVVIIRNKNKSERTDEVYKIKNGTHFSIETEGITKQTITKKVILLDITNASKCIMNLYVEQKEINTIVGAKTEYIRSEKYQEDYRKRKELEAQNAFNYPIGYYKVISKIEILKSPWSGLSGSQTGKYLDIGQRVYVKERCRRNKFGKVEYKNGWRTSDGWILLEVLEKE